MKIYIPYNITQSDFPQALAALDWPAPKTICDIILPTEICHHFVKPQKLSKYEIEDILIEQLADDPQNLCYQYKHSANGTEVVAVAKTYSSELLSFLRNNKLKVGRVLAQGHEDIELVAEQSAANKYCWIVSLLLICVMGIMIVKANQHQELLNSKINLYQSRIQQTKKIKSAVKQQTISAARFSAQQTANLIKQVSSLPQNSSLWLKDIQVGPKHCQIAGYSFDDNPKSIFEYLATLKTIPHFTSANLQVLEKQEQENAVLLYFQIISG
ncbi:hypothetical protein ACFL4D_02055 [Candidatus Margulisiibacteriota bacterium]